MRDAQWTKIERFSEVKSHLSLFRIIPSRALHNSPVASPSSSSLSNFLLFLAFLSLCSGSSFFLAPSLAAHLAKASSFYWQAPLKEKRAMPRQEDERLRKMKAREVTLTSNNTHGAHRARRVNFFGLVEAASKKKATPLGIVSSTSLVFNVHLDQ